jgi:hypothetical protein
MAKADDGQITDTPEAAFRPTNPGCGCEGCQVGPGRASYKEHVIG